MSLTKKLLSAITLFSLFLSNALPGAVAVAAPAPLSIVEDAFALPDARVGTPYSYQFQTEGGLAPLTWRVADGELPPGIRLELTGKLTGTPTTPRREAFSFVIEVSDSSQPPQKFLQPTLLLVQAAPLRIVTTPTKLRIVPPQSQSESVLPAQPSTNGGNGGNSETQVVETAPPPASNHSAVVASIRESIRASSISSQLGLSNKAIEPIEKTIQQAAAQQSPVRTRAGFRRSDEKMNDKINPATFIRIYEETEGGKRLEIYNPEKQPQERLMKLSADLNSKLVILPDVDLMNEDMPLNKLFMSAFLEPSNTPVEVIGYAEIGQARATGEAQRGMSFQSIKNIQSMLLNMAIIADDIVTGFYGIDPEENLLCEPQKDVNTKIAAMKTTIQNKDNSLRAALKKAPPDKEDNELIARLEDRLRVYKPEIMAISDFFLDESNQTILKSIGAEIFSMDSQALQQTAAQYKENLSVAFDAGSTPDAKGKALLDLLERTKIVHRYFEVLKSEILTDMRKKKDFEKDYCDKPEDVRRTIRRDAYLTFGKHEREKAVMDLKKFIAEGHILLKSARAGDGNRLILKVEARGEDNENLGIPAVFEIEIKQYGPKFLISDSFMFIKRLGLKDSDINPPDAAPPAVPGRGIGKVNYAPSPGVTMGFNYFKRGENISDKFFRALAPGAGANVSFMNFNDSTFDLKEGKFVNTNGVNVQIGVGVVGSLFNNKLQFSYGYNLNADQKRRYFGVGFGFIGLATEFASRLGQFIK